MNRLSRTEFLLFFDSVVFAAVLLHVLQRSKSDACEEQIQDELHRHVKKCVCPKQYRMHKITDGQYRVSCFYDDCLLYCYSYCYYRRHRSCHQSSEECIVIMVITISLQCVAVRSVL